MEPDAPPERAPLERPLPPPTWRDVLDRVLEPVRGRPGRAIGALVAVAGLVATGVGAWWVLRPPPAPATELTLPSAGASSGAPAPAATAGPTSTTTAAELVVHAAGAVVVPGVHRLAPGSRVGDLLAAAGGPAPDADVDRVNLAAPLADGQRVWFPRVGEAAEPPVAAGAGPGSGTGSPAGPVELNTATAEELDTLPGIGPSLAAAIVEHRERNGPFRSVEELLDVPGIGPAKLDAIRDLVTVS